MPSLRRCDTFLLAALALGLPLLMLTPLLTGLFPNTHDGLIHFHRIINAAHSLQEGILWTRWSPYLHLGYGYPIGNFYPPFWHILAGTLLNAGLPVLVIWYLCQAAAISLHTVGAYLFGKQLGSRTGALLAVAISAYAPFRLFEIMEQGNLSQFIAMGLMAWVLWSIVRYVQHPSRRQFAMVALLVAAIVVTHHPTAFFFLPVAGLYGLFAAWFAPNPQAVTRFKRLSGVVLAFGLALALSAIYWLPATLEAKEVRLQAATNQYQAAEFLVPLSEVIGFNFTMDATQVNPPRAINVGIVGWGMVLLGAVIALLPQAPLSRWQRWNALLAFAVMALCIYMVSFPSAWLWENIAPLKLILYPWRLLGLAAVATIPATMVVWHVIPRRWQSGALLLGLAVVIATALPAMTRSPQPITVPTNPTPGDSVRFEIATGNVGLTSTAEYTPATSSERPQGYGCPECYDDWHWGIREGKLPNSITLVEKQNIFAGTRFVVEASENATLPLHQFAFVGWQASINGEPVPIRPETPSGIMLIDLPMGRSTLEVWYAGTTVQHVADLVTLSALIIAFSLVVLRVRPIPNNEVTPESNRIAIAVMVGALGLALIVVLVLKPYALTNARVSELQTPIASFVDKTGQPLIDLLAIDIPSEARQSEWLQMRLYWVARQPLASGWTASILGDERAPVGLDSAIWQVDRVLVDTRVLQIAPDALPYGIPLEVELRNQVTRQRLSATLGSLRIVGSESCELPPNAIPVSLAFGDVLTMRGYTLQNSELALYWQVNQPALTDYALMLHFMQGDTMIGNADQAPIAAYPMNLWKTKQCLSQRYLLTLPEGTDSLAIAFYDRETFARLPLVGAVNDAWVVEFP